jgi:hypothetical protein
MLFSAAQRAALLQLLRHCLTGLTAASTPLCCCSHRSMLLHSPSTPAQQSLKSLEGGVQRVALRLPSRKPRTPFSGCTSLTAATAEQPHSHTTCAVT